MLRCFAANPQATMAPEMGIASKGLRQCTSSNIRSVEAGPPLRSQEIGEWKSMRGVYTLGERCNIGSC